MRKILFILAMLLSVACYGQRRFIPNHYQYNIVDSLPLERITIYSPYDYESDKVIYLGGGDYLIELPHKDKMVICYNGDKSKAIVLYNSYCFGRHKEFNIKDSKKRLILWYEDSNLYCGYIYDKTYKVCKYFEAR